MSYGRHSMVFVRWYVFDSLIGPLSYALSDEGAVNGVHFGAHPDAVAASGPVRDEFQAYFAGELTAFTVPMHVRRGSGFERAVWEQMTLIPYGETRSYGYVAQAVGEPGGAQAVGVACNRNPLPVIVPCHRIIGSDGKLVGFGGGLPIKRKLLELEAATKMQLDWS